MKPLPHEYSVNLSYNGNMEGALNSEGQTTINYAAPVDFDGPGTGWSPETMLLASVSSCVALTFASIAKMMKVDFTDLQIQVKGIVNNMPNEKRMHFAEIALQPALKLGNPPDESKLPKIWENTEKHCLVSNSLTSKITIAPTQLS